MLNDPFGDPFRPRAGSSWSEIFQNKSGGIRPRNPVAAPTEEEPELIPLSTDLAAKESKHDKAILKNPRWVTETVGFNEEADISVEAVLPESQADKTRVLFELFAQTPAGAEKISKAEGHVSKGKAVARIPVYIPQYRDEKWNTLSEVDYFFTAKHGASDLLKDESVVKRVKGMASLVLASHVLPAATFDSGTSRIRPEKVHALKALAR
ncbi:MAG TPA: hypothetical protein VK465_18630, partial [Fibrobacteria bacterium]|nr:hypothetical protein [Fibrobacteria bacterium]